MEARKILLDRSFIEARNYEVKKRFEFYRQQLARLEDHDRPDRLESQQCIACFRQSRMAGQAFTSRPCAICETILQHGNTDVDILCIDCARIAKLCKHCGADIDLKNRRERTLADGHKEQK